MNDERCPREGSATESGQDVNTILEPAADPRAVLS